MQSRIGKYRKLKSKKLVYLTVTLICVLFFLFIGIRIAGASSDNLIALQEYFLFLLELGKLGLEGFVEFLKG